jgi:hypothetical protein
MMVLIVSETVLLSDEKHRSERIFLGVAAENDHSGVVLEPWRHV